MSKKCCAKCFSDNSLAQRIESRSKKIGKCDFCGSYNVKLFEPSDLVDDFDVLFGLYKESEDPTACSIESLLRTDWALFENLTTVKAMRLLQLIFSDSNMFEKRYTPIVQHDISAIQEWSDFREELKHRNRFFPKNIQATEQLKELFGFLTPPPTDIPAKVFRARICEQSQMYTLDQMGKPPLDSTSNGRANPVGIPCLYVASDKKTAIAEVRPNKGEKVCVAEFKADKEIQFADLRNPRKTISPFILSEEQIRLLRRYMEYLCRLSEELTLPVSPKSAHLEYLPSQYLCEFIKHCGFDGLMYKSSMGTGINYAIFNDAKVTNINVEQYRINELSVEYSKCKDK
jgi:hypothetical protein